MNVFKRLVRITANLHIPPRRLLFTVAILSSPAALVFVTLRMLGEIGWLYTLSAILIVTVGIAVAIALHLVHVEGLRRYVEELRRSKADDSSRPDPPETGVTWLAPGLRETIAATMRERQQRRRELAAAMASTESVLAGLPDPLMMLDHSCRILRTNPAAQRLFGSALADRYLASVVRNPLLLDAADVVVKGGEGRVIEFSLPGSVERHFIARAEPLTTPTLEGTVAIVSLHDITGIKRAERMRADFVANASHELRTPLSSLVGFIETLRGPARDDPEALPRFLAIMDEQAQRMSRLVEDLLSLSRIEMREHTPPTGTADIRQALRDVVGTLEFKAQAKRMKIDVSAPHLPQVTGEQDELTQVFQNLIDNAIKYGRAGTAIRVAARKVSQDHRAAVGRLEGPAIAISVVDEGEGISREHLPRLTERFYRVDATQSRRLGGTGLGLAIVKHIVNRHRGALEIDSRVGRGSVFTVYLPVARKGNASRNQSQNGH